MALEEKSPLTKGLLEPDESAAAVGAPAPPAPIPPRRRETKSGLTASAFFSRSDSAE